MSRNFVIGYDPGGYKGHGIALITVGQKQGRWEASDLYVSIETTLDAALIWVEGKCVGGRIVAVGIDTLTEWNTGSAGWRPADVWLRNRYPRPPSGSVGAPNGLRGAMVINGAAFLLRLSGRLARDGSVVTEAHPKVCYYALTGQVYDSDGKLATMGMWLEQELGLPSASRFMDPRDDAFDAGMAALAALRGLNQDWKNDLHNLPVSAGSGTVVRFGAPTHYWWPDP